MNISYSLCIRPCSSAAVMRWAFQTNRFVVLFILLFLYQPQQSPRQSAVVYAWSVNTPMKTTPTSHLTRTRSAHSSSSYTCSSSSTTYTTTTCMSCSSSSSSSSNTWTAVLSRGLATSLLFLVATFMSPLVIDSSPFSTRVAWAEDELSNKYSTQGFDASLVDQSCFIQHCALPTKTCLAQDADCRKGLICTAKCLGNNSCITGCMARYGNTHLDDFLKCTIEDHSCIHIAIVPGGNDLLEQAPLAPIPTLQNFQISSLEGAWYKVIGFNPNYDCYPCQRNTFTSMSSSSKEDGGVASPTLQVDVEFSMPRMIPDDYHIPIPASLKRDIISFRQENENTKEKSKSEEGSTPLSIGLNDYQTREVMIFDTDSSSSLQQQQQRTIDWNHFFTLGQGTNHEISYRRTAHSEGEMFGLKFWENWYMIGENDPGMQEFKFIYYNGKTRQNTYEGAFVYSRSKSLNSDALRKVYQIASDAGMNPHQFCKIQNGCFRDQEEDGKGGGGNAAGFLGSPSNPFRGILASTKVSQLLGVEPVAAEGVLKSTQTVSDKLRLKRIQERRGGEGESQTMSTNRPWHQELGDYLENPHRHFNAMDSLRVPMKWPDSVTTVNEE